uniref:Uncharacterized protein n=1 Tax=Pseudictyota dubia TaxID=2749911 RepID=A0A6U2IU20_9STRA|mmetsp:Transcript_6900/g.12372  ORF Transcript_6900/g.12372 Transcript_6900/m.12372 type:complete len:270 (+) Transcript_6900:157-966(+)
MTLQIRNFFQSRTDGMGSHGREPGTSLMDLVSSEDWKLAHMECDMNPREASRWVHRQGFFDGIHDSNVLPLHQACALRPNTEIIEVLIYAYPEGVKSTESTFHRLPIHVACQTGASVDVMKVLLDKYGDGSRAKDSLGRLPIHYACSHGAPLEIIETLLESFPAAAACPDKNGWLPLHVACRTGASSPDVIRALIDAFPSSVLARTKKGSTPLICARKSGEKGLKAVEVLEEALQTNEKHGEVHDLLTGAASNATGVGTSPNARHALGA